MMGYCERDGHECRDAVDRFWEQRLRGRSVESREGSEKRPMMGYYERDGYECREAIAIATEGLEGFEAFAVGNIVKYAWRAGLKPNTTFEEDMEKCGEYARMLCERRDV